MNPRIESGFSVSFRTSVGAGVLALPSDVFPRAMNVASTPTLYPPEPRACFVDDLTRGPNCRFGRSWRLSKKIVRPSLDASALSSTSLDDGFAMPDFDSAGVDGAATATSFHPATVAEDSISNVASFAVGDLNPLISVFVLSVADTMATDACLRRLWGGAFTGAFTGGDASGRGAVVEETRTRFT